MSTLSEQSGVLVYHHHGDVRDPSRTLIVILFKLASLALLIQKIVNSGLQCIIGKTKIRSKLLFSSTRLRLRKLRREEEEEEEIKGEEKEEKEDEKG